MPDHDPIQDSDHLLPPHKKKSGPIVGTVIILIVLVIGGIYFWNNALGRNQNPADQVPYIPSGTTTLPTTVSTSSTP